MTKKVSISEAAMAFFVKALRMNKEASQAPLRLGCPSATYEDKVSRIAHASTLRGGKGFTTYSTKVKVGSDRGNKRRACKHLAFDHMRDMYAAQIANPLVERDMRAAW